MTMVDQDMIDRARKAAAELRSARAASAALLRDAIIRCTIHTDRVDVEARLLPLIKAFGLSITESNHTLHFSIAATVRRGGRAVRFINEQGATAAPADVDIAALLSAVGRAQSWWQELCADPQLNPRKLAQREGIDPGYVGRVLKLAFLAPPLVEQWANRTAPASITLRQLLRDDVVQPDWAVQRERLKALAARG